MFSKIIACRSSISINKIIFSLVSDSPCWWTKFVVKPYWCPASKQNLLNKISTNYFKYQNRKNYPSVVIVVLYFFIKYKNFIFNALMRLKPMLLKNYFDNICTFHSDRVDPWLRKELEAPYQIVCPISPVNPAAVRRESAFLKDKKLFGHDAKLPQLYRSTSTTSPKRCIDVQ